MVDVKVTTETFMKAQKGSRGISLLFFETRRWIEGVHVSPRANTSVSSTNRPGIHCTGDWVGPRGGLGVEVLSPYRDSIPRPSGP
jgi:hypothetical protein